MSKESSGGVALEDQDPAKRESILAAAVRTFAREGFPATDVQEVATAAGVGKGTVYRYFGNKRELFCAAAHDGLQRLEICILEELAETEGLVDQVRSAGLAYAGFFQEHPELVEILIQERAEFRGSIQDTHLLYREKNRGRFEDILRAGITQGVFRELDAGETTSVFANLLYGTVVCGCLGGGHTQLREQARHAIDLFLHSICNKEKK